MIEEDPIQPPLPPSQQQQQNVNRKRQLQITATYCILVKVLVKYTWLKTTPSSKRLVLLLLFKLHLFHLIVRNPDTGSISNKWALNTSVNYKNQKSPDWCRRSPFWKCPLTLFQRPSGGIFPWVVSCEALLHTIFTFHNTTEQTTAVEPTHYTKQISCVVLLTHNCML